MKDQELDNLLRDWANAQLPDDVKRNAILQSIPARSARKPFRRVFVAALSGMAAVAAMLLFVLTLPPPTVQITTIPASSGSTDGIQANTPGPTGVQVDPTGVPVGVTGVPVGVTGVPVGLTGVPVDPTGVPVDLTGVPVGVTGVPVGDPVRVSLLVLKQLPDSDSAFEFLEDTILVAGENTLHELELGDHHLFLWIYPLEQTLFSLDVGLDNAAETGIVAIPDHTQALRLQSNGDRFDVFVSVLPNT